TAVVAAEWSCSSGAGRQRAPVRQSQTRETRRTFARNCGDFVKLARARSESESEERERGARARSERARGERHERQRARAIARVKRFRSRRANAPTAAANYCR